MAEKLTQEQQVGSVFLKISELAREDWERVYSELMENEDYKGFQTLKNCGIVLKTLSIDLPEYLHSTLLLEAQPRKETSASILLAFSTGQLDWYQELFDQLPSDLQSQPS